MEQHSYIPAERQKRMIEYIEANTSAQIHELAERFGVSEATVRRDLDEMDHRGRIKRTHGGAMKLDRSTAYESKYSEKMNLMTDAKQRIALRAAALVHNGDTVLLDSGTTTYFIAQQLSALQDLTVITNDLGIALNTQLHPSSTLGVTGGMRRPDYQELVGSQAENFIQETRVNVAFLGADGVDLAFGVTNANFAEIGVKRLMIAAAMRPVLCCDHSKFGRASLARICGLDRLSTLITDDGLDAEYAAKVRRLPQELMTV